MTRRGVWLTVVMSLATGCGAGEGSDSSFGGLSLGSSATAPATAGSTSAAGDDDTTAGDGAAEFGEIGDPQTGTGEPGMTGPNAEGELCNGEDDNLDGTVDEGFDDLTCGQGACLTTAPACVGGVPQQCIPLEPGVESCNGIDDDCDGVTDEDLQRPCSTACGEGVETCTAGAWGGCDAPQPQAEVCDVLDQNCDGLLDEGVANCRVSVHRSYSAATGEHFYTTDFNEAQCCGYAVENQNYYDIYAGSHPGLTGWYRCVKPSGLHLYTTSSTCEGTTVEGLMGYVSITELPGSTPLYRSFNGNNGDHLFTTSLAEHQGAVAGPYVDEGIVAYVW